MSKVDASSAIQVGCGEDVVWVRVAGKGSFQNSSRLKEFSRRMMERGYRRFVIDFEGCTGMDSTFMGTLAGLGLRLNQTGRGSLHVININERNLSLLQNLGLDRIFIMGNEDADSLPPGPPLVGEGGSPDSESSDPAHAKTEQARIMLEAHEALVKVDPENLPKFKDVLDYLRQDLGEERSH